MTNEKTKQTKQINKGDWSGEIGKYTFTKNTIVVHAAYDLKFKLVWVKDEDGYESVRVLSKEHGYDEMFYVLRTSDNEWISCGAFVEREADNPYDVIAQVVWSTF